MVRIGIICVCLSINAIASAANSKTALSKSDREAAPDLKKYLTLRNEYAKRFAGGWFTNRERRDFMALYDTDKAAFLDKSGEWLRRCPIDAKVHMMRALLLTLPNQAAEKRYHRTMFFGLMDSLFATGNGKSCQSAYYAVNINEEYMLLDAIGAKPLRNTVHGRCDVIDAKLDGKRTRICFEMSRSFAATRENTVSKNEEDQSH